ncbi:hypothetical protein D3093_25090 (plasmid) [Azospirillum argentinense]|uniref:Uncharacterized protein n=1 Tax=Azospirillum argentinense TaxID=2970906 RepID=A0A4D8PMY0_9PROT|nr:hypothetical protein D3093_25090 [Azospirillum argentinense]
MVRGSVSGTIGLMVRHWVGSDARQKIIDRVTNIGRSKTQRHSCANIVWISESKPHAMPRTRTGLRDSGCSEMSQTTGRRIIRHRRLTNA